MGARQTTSPATTIKSDLAVGELFLKGMDDDEERTASFVASTKAMDADGDVVEQVWRLERYRSNPVVLFAHDSRSLPIGRATSIEVVGGRLEATVQFASKEANPLAEQVYRSVQEGTLKAVSVGFRPHEVRQEMREDKTVLVLSDNELFELSVVPIPNNAEALRKHKAAMAYDKAVVPQDAPPAVETDEWDSSAATTRVAGWATRDGDLDHGKHKMAFAWYDSGSADTKGAYKLPHHDIQNGSLITVRAGVIAAGNAIARGGVDIPDSEMAGVKAHLAKHYKQFDLTPPWAREESVNGGKEQAMDLEEITKQLDGERNKVSVLDQRCKDLEEERNIWKGKADSYYQKIVENRLDALVGKKITPKEKETLLKLSVADEALFDEHLKAVSEREDMPYLKENVIGDDPSPPSLPDGDLTQSGSAFDKMIMHRAFGG